MKASPWAMRNGRWAWGCLWLVFACSGKQPGEGTTSRAEPRDRPTTADTRDDAASRDTLPSHAGDHPGAETHAQHGGRELGRGGGHGHAVDHDFSDVRSFAKIFDHRDRDAWQKPDEVVRHLALSEGMTVVDLGAGTGYFLPHLSPAVGRSGRVIALDNEPGMVEHMRVRARDAQLENVTAREVASDDPGLDPVSVHRILVVNTWHHLPARVEYARKLAGALAPDGRILVVDYTLDAERGPPRQVRLSSDVIVRELRQAGLSARVIDETLPHQYIVEGTLTGAR